MTSITRITLDQTSIIMRNADIAYDKERAIADLLAHNHFDVMGATAEKLHLHLKTEYHRLILQFYAEEDNRLCKEINTSLRSLRPIVKDYLLICESYREALNQLPAHKLEAIDMGRRSLHNEGATGLITLLTPHFTMDFETARRLFSLLCVLHRK